MGDPGGPRGGRHDVHQDRSLGEVHSALELRLALATVGFVASVAGLVVTTLVTEHLGWAVLFGVLVAVTGLNITVVSLRLAQRRRRRRERGSATGRAGSDHTHGREV